jgi:hypothetical protein
MQQTLMFAQMNHGSSNRDVTPCSMVHAESMLGDIALKMEAEGFWEFG